MAIAILIGILIGIVGFLPLLGALKISKKIVATRTGLNAAVMIFSILISLAIMIVSMLIFNDLNHSNILPFVLSAAITLIITAIGFGIWFQIKHS
ncbi:hypothetical protein [Phoenicibacter congonensis]|uniref:hypothetical protein n=1 Tax=Phoenicibacter congonensis TaxID=1944646 RepID=UPI0009A6202F|nr:hypothetical protein [Phoenicibacter congonensis]